jgi:hypothetical protein
VVTCILPAKKRECTGVLAGFHGSGNKAPAGVRNSGAGVRMPCPGRPSRRLFTSVRSLCLGGYDALRAHCVWAAAAAVGGQPRSVRARSPATGFRLRAGIRTHGSQRAAPASAWPGGGWGAGGGGGGREVRARPVFLFSTVATQAGYVIATFMLPRQHCRRPLAVRTSQAPGAQN